MRPTWLAIRREGQGEVVPASDEQPRRWRWRLLKGLLIAAAAAIAVVAVSGQTGELTGAEGYLEHVTVVWVVLAVAAEVASYVAFGALQRSLLREGGADAGLVLATSVSFAGNAIQNSLPGGVVISAAFAYRQYRRVGADDVLCGWVVVAMTLLSMTSLALLAGVGVVLATNFGGGTGLAAVVGGVVVVVGIALGLWHERLRLVGHAVRLLRLSQRIIHRPERDAREVVHEALVRMGSISPTRRAWVVASVYATGNWVFDMTALVAAYLAVGAAVPWRGVLLAYGAAQLATNLPITPGGLGVVEGSLTIALVAFGGDETSTVAAVLLYRLVNFWGTLPVGWTAWTVLNVRHRRARRTAAARPAPLAVAG